ncbi:MAG: hypothetical protein U0L98_04645 [Clostridia bacterium]|nr:hypothetical protein [Clostridia bacterium]
MKKNEEKMMSKVTIPTPNDKGVEIAIDVQKVAILVKSKLLNITKEKTQYKRYISVEKMLIEPNQDLKEMIRKRVELKGLTIIAKIQEIACDEMATNKEEINDIVKRVIEEELGNNKEDIIAEALAKSVLNLALKCKGKTKYAS